MYGKIVDNKIKYVNDNVSRIEGDGHIVLNPRLEEDFAKCGYVLLVPATLPEETETTSYYNAYEIVDGVITAVVKEAEKSDEEI